MNVKYNGSWDGQDWEDYVHALLSERHGGANIQRVPAKDKGDMGIETYTVDSPACVYQCYAPDYPAELDAITKKIQAKIRKDTKKFRENKTKILTHVKQQTFSRWILVVPIFQSKQNIETCANACERIIKAELPYVAPDFKVLIQDQVDFAPQIDTLKNKANSYIKTDFEKVPVSEVPKWSSENDFLANRLKGKISNGYVGRSDKQLEETFNKFVIAFIESGNFKDKLRENSPETWEFLNAETESAVNDLVFIPPSGEAIEILKEKQKDLTEKFNSHLLKYPPADVNRLTWGTIADWLMECHLNFSENNNE